VWERPISKAKIFFLEAEYSSWIYTMLGECCTAVCCFAATLLRYSLGQQQRIIKIKSYAEKEKGPVTAICDIDDLLLLCIGPKIMLYHW